MARLLGRHVGGCVGKRVGAHVVIKSVGDWVGN